jgi:cytochrome c oxidase subunit 2
MIRGQRSRSVHICRGLVLMATVLMGPRIAAAGQPVHEVQILARRYTFEPASIQVVAGETVRLIVRSKDGIHGFAIPKLKIDMHIQDGGEPVTADFVAPAAGEYEITCSEFCGRGHGQMKAVLVSVAATRTNR